MSSEFIVTAERHRVVRKTTENGETIRTSTIYKKGDKVTLSDAEAQRLLRAGGIRRVDDDADPAAGARLPNSAVVPVSTGDRVESPGALSGQTADEGLREASVPSPEAIAAHQASLEAAEKARQEFNEANGTKSDVPDDGYDDLDYPNLQRAAKERGVEHTGKKKEIVARLRAYDADQVDGDEDENENEDNGS